jgi:phage repressor protein C with HTH and peptisase S24 domain
MNENFTGIGKRISNKLLELNLKQVDLVKITNISKNAISNYINGIRTPDTLSTYKIAKALKVSMEWLLTGEDHTTNKKTDLILNDLEEECLHIFRQLSQANKYRTLGYMEAFLQNQNTPPPIKKPTKKVPIIGTVAAGSPILATNYFEDFIETDNFKADYALIIKGDSMEPLIKDKEIVLVQKTTVSEGEIGIFIIGTTPEDSEATCKKLKKISNYHIQLISINPRHEPIDIDLTKEQVRAIGKVLI